MLISWDFFASCEYNFAQWAKLEQEVENMKSTKSTNTKSAKSTKSNCAGSKGKSSNCSNSKKSTKNSSEEGEGDPQGSYTGNPIGWGKYADPVQDVDDL